jgi:acetolactate synthase-1/3 small subunit
MRGTKHTIVALVENKPGVLNRIANKWRQRGFNIESLAVGHSEVPGLSRMTFVLGGPAADVEQVTKQLYKIIDVVRISDLAEDEIVTRELALMKVNATDQNRSAIIAIVEIFRGEIVDVSPDAVVVEVTGVEEKVNAAFEMLKPYGVRELARTGRVAVTRGRSLLTLEAGEAAGERRYRSAGEGKPRVGSLL